MSTAILRAVHTALTGDANVTAILGDRLFDRVPEQARTPYLTYGALTDKPLDGEGLIAHALVLDVWSRKRGRTEVADAIGALSAALNGAALSITGWHCVDCRITQTQTGAEGPDAMRGTLRLRIVSEPL